MNKQLLNNQATTKVKTRRSIPKQLRQARPVRGALQRVATPSHPVTRPVDILTLQRTIGNKNVTRLLASRNNAPYSTRSTSRSTIQAKPLVEPVGKHSEQQANQVAKPSGIKPISTPLYNLSATLSPQLVQRKVHLAQEVNPNGFNMIGEVHSESDKRREEERAYLTERGLDVKEENQTITVRGAQELLDPVHLRIGESLEFIVRHVQYMKESKRESKKQGFAKLLIQLINRIFPKILGNSMLRDRFNEFWDDKGLGNYGEGSRRLKEVYDELVLQGERVKVEEKKFGKKSKRRWEGYLNIIEGEAGEMILEIQQALNTEEPLALERSREMHNSATRHSARPIAWKVGDDHIEDIQKAFNNEDVEYTLMSKDTFDMRLAEQ